MGRADGPGSESEGHSSHGFDGGVSDSGGGGGGGGGNDNGGNDGGGWVQTSPNTWSRVGPTPAPTQQEQRLIDAIAERLSRGGSSSNNVIADIIAGNIGGSDNPVARSLGNYTNNPEAQSFLGRYASSYVNPQGNLTYRNPLEFARRMGENYMGFDKSKTMMQNIANQMIPGGKTPLGILAAVPGVAGASQGVQNAVTLGNYLAGQAGIGVNKPEQPQTLMEKAMETNMSPAEFLQEQFRQNQANPQAQTTGTPVSELNVETPFGFSVQMPDLQVNEGMYINEMLDRLGVPTTGTVPTPLGDVNVQFENRPPPPAPAPLSSNTFNDAASYQVAGLDDIAGNLFGNMSGATTFMPDKGLQRKGNTYTSYNPGSNVKQGTSGWDITTVGEALSNIWDAGKSSYRQ
jgi:hypothetical protein